MYGLLFPSSLLFPWLLWLGNAFAVLATIVIPAQAHFILAPAALASPLVLPIAHALAGRGGCDSRRLGAKIGRQVWCVLWCHARIGRRNGAPDDNEERRRNLRRRGFHLGGSQAKCGRHQSRSHFLLVSRFLVVKSTSACFCSEVVAGVVDNHDRLRPLLAAAPVAAVDTARRPTIRDTSASLFRSFQ